MGGCTHFDDRRHGSPPYRCEMSCRGVCRFLYLPDCGLASLLVCNIHAKNFQDNCNTVITVIVITVIEITVMVIL